MKVNIVKNQKFPKDVDKWYEPVWDEFIGMRAVKELRLRCTTNEVIQDCFRLMINQAGANTKVLNTVKHYIQLEPPLKAVKSFIRKYDMGRNMRISAPARTIKFEVSELTCSSFNFKFEFAVMLTPQRFDAEFFVNRLKGIMYNEVPQALASKLPNGKERKLKKLNLSERSTVSDFEYYTAYSKDNVTLYMYRTYKGILLRIVYAPTKVLPTFPKFESTLNKDWQITTRGIIR